MLADSSISHMLRSSVMTSSRIPLFMEDISKGAYRPNVRRTS
jgi:hypothetical protein